MPMWKFNWTSYVGEQIKWAEALISKADNIHGYDAEVLRAKSAAILADISRLVGEGLSGTELSAPRMKKEIPN